MPDEHERPITLYVSRFEFENISLEHLERKRVSVIDVEMSYQETERLMKFLEKRMATKTPGSVRIRIFGNLVIS